MKKATEIRIEKLNKDRRFGIVAVDIEVVAEWLLRPSEFYAEVVGLPHNAVFMHAFYAPTRVSLQLLYAHESFEKVPQGQEVPLLDVSYTKSYLYKITTKKPKG